MRDLEMRGAGNVVGAEQSGQVAAVGFEMYTQLLKEEVADLTGEPIQQEVDITLDLPVDAHLPKDYVEDERPAARALQADRRDPRRPAGSSGSRPSSPTGSGRHPGPARKLLLTLAALKAALRRWGVVVTEVVITPGLERLHRHAVVKSDTGILLIPLPRPGPDDVVAWVAGVLRDLFAAPRKGR
jgi:transcription-repair coupling factor (superfamily II helicase)